MGEILRTVARPNGLIIQKRAVPMGVIAIIYESRPNVTSDAAALALKSGNVCVLRGGKEAYRSAQAIVTALKAGLTSGWTCRTTFVNLVEDTTRQSATELMHAVGYVDLLIPRGGRRPHPRLCGERHRALYRDRHRYLPCLCGRGGGCGYGGEHH